MKNYNCTALLLIALLKLLLTTSLSAQDILYCVDYLPSWHPTDPAFDPPPVDPPAGWPNCEAPPVTGEVLPVGFWK